MLYNMNVLYNICYMTVLYNHFWCYVTYVI